MSAAANNRAGEDDLVDAAVAWLSESLPSSWQVGRAPSAAAESDGPTVRTLDAGIELRANNGTGTTLAVEARRSFSPRDAERLFSGVAGSLRALARHIPVLVVAPWLSPRTQELLAAEDINYIDLAGNARLQLENPALYVRSVGSAHSPARRARSQSSLRGPKAGRLVRLLADVVPPYGVREIAGVAKLSPGYVSRLLDTLDREALIDRDDRGGIISVDVASILRQWTQTYDVFKSNDAASYVAPGGPGVALERLGSLEGVGRVAITGSFAAVRRAPVAAPALLTVYCDDVPAVANELSLLPADAGANVALLHPFDPVVWARTEAEEGLPYAAVSQVAADCLGGNGRMPAEGEALLRWMSEDETRWRARSLGELSPIGEAA